MRLIGFLLLGAALALVGPGPGARAQNGLERFEREIKPQLEVKKFTYGSASAQGTSGFVLNDVVAIMPPSAATGGKESTLKIDKVVVDEIDFDRLKKGDDDLPRFAKIRLEGMTGDDDSLDQLAAYGVPRTPMDVTLDYKLDGAAKVFTLNKLEISLRGQGRLALALVVDGVSDKGDKMDSAKDDGRLRIASLTIDDTGLLAKVLPAAAKEQGNTADGLVSLTLISIAGFADGQGADTLKALDAVASFVGDWKAPKGPLVVSMKPAKKAGLDDLAGIMAPNALTEVFGLTATYPNSRAGAAKAGPASK